MLLFGVVLWLIGSIVIRLAGQHLLAIEPAILYLISFVLWAGLTPWLVKRHADKARAALLLILPTLVLDAIAAAYFPLFFPNVPPSAAGVFGGWMLVSCAGAAAGVLVRR